MLVKFFASRLFFVIFICLSILTPIVNGLYMYYVNIYYPNIYHNTNSGLYGCEFTLLAVFIYLLLCLFLFGILTFFIGIARLIYEKKGKIEKNKVWHVKSLIVKGIIAIILSCLLLFIIMEQGPFITDPFDPLPKCMFNLFSSNVTFP